MKAILLGSLEVLSDTSDLWRSAFRQAFLDHGLQFEPRRGRPQLFRRPLRPEDRAAVPVGAILRARNAHYAEALSHGPLSARPGLDDLLDGIARQGLGFGLVVTTPLDWSVALFDGLNLPPERFDAIVTGNHVAADKPAPDCYHLAAALLATAPEDCLAVENSRAGVAAARAARMQVMDLTEGADTMSDLVALLPRDATAPALPR